jgi:molecular chaperone DnaK
MQEALPSANVEERTKYDELAAQGLAARGGALRGELKNFLLLDVASESFGLELTGGRACRLIHRNTTIPTSRKGTFTTAVDDQTAVVIHVIQGDREFARDCRSIAKFALAGIVPAPRALPQIEVEFAIDACGWLDVTATDKATGNRRMIKCDPFGEFAMSNMDGLPKHMEILPVL